MKLNRKLSLYIYLGAVFLLFATGIYQLPPLTKIEKILTANITATPTPRLSREYVQVSKVIDGDTIQTADGKTIRYIGIDTPETKHPVKKVQCFGKEASGKNRELVLNKFIKLEKDVSETDRYGRLLRYVRVFESPVATGEGVFVNEYLVKEGYAYAATFPPDVKYADLFELAQEEARENNKGLWKNCK